MIEVALIFSLLSGAAPDAGSSEPPLTTARVLEESKPADWRTLDPNDTLYVDVPGGRVVIELAPGFAPAHVENIRALAREHYFDGLFILRSQDNYVVQWGDPNADDREHAKPLGSAKAKLPAEFTRASRGLPFTALPDRDVYAPEAGWSDGFPVARDPKSGQTWLAHCYGVVGAGRDMAADNSNGTELYVVIGHAPRHLDRNITVVGRVVKGMELLSSLPRGSGALGSYERPEQRVPLSKVRLASTVPESERVKLELLRTDTPAFRRLIEARRNRREEWFVNPVGHVDLCNVPLPTR